MLPLSVKKHTGDHMTDDIDCEDLVQCIVLAFDPSLKNKGEKMVNV